MPGDDGGSPVEWTLGHGDHAMARRVARRTCKAYEIVNIAGVYDEATERATERATEGATEGATGPGTELADGAGKRPLRRRILRWSAGLVFVGFWVWFTNGRVNYVSISPGPTASVGERISVSGTDQYATEGKVLWATVNLLDRPSPLEAVYGWIKGDVDVFKRRAILGDATSKESAQESRADMDDAKLVAQIVAARTLGIKAEGGGAEIAEITKTAPSAKLLKVGDVITAIEGRAVCLQGDVRPGMAGKKPGDTVLLTVRSGSAKPRDLRVQTITGNGVQRALIGVILAPDADSPCRLPFKVEVDTTRVGGPSAGLAMTLAIIDRLSPGDLTGGGTVAVTGEINADGSVGEVGGVKQKTVAVRAAGAKLFIVPTGELLIAKAHANGMQVVGVDTLDQALAALRKVGGAPLPSPGR